MKGYRYGLANGEVRVVFFDIYHNGEWLAPDETREICEKIGIDYVPVLYRGPWSPELEGLADGDTVLGKGAHIREGCVVKPLVPRRDPECGRVILKIVSVDYLSGKKKRKP